MTLPTQQDGLSDADIGLADGRQSSAALAIQRGVTRLWRSLILPACRKWRCPITVAPI